MYVSMLVYFIFLNSKLFYEKIKELLTNFHTFDFLPRYLPKYIDMRDFPPNNIFFWRIEAFHQISASQIECKLNKGRFFEGKYFHILLKSHPILNIDQDLVSQSDIIFLLPLCLKIVNP